ncbi:hypothetical protein B0T39_20355 [Chromobacterium haemolyticum]|nr:hypothetical protein B0T39_20355 [Chromobacterium haemolyticum]
MKQLASHHTISSKAVNGLSDQDGPLTIKIDGKEITVKLDGLGDSDGMVSAKALAQAINDHPDNKSLVRASTVTLPDGNVSVTLQSVKTGASQKMEVSSNSQALKDIFEGAVTTGGEDAVFKYNGQEYTWPSNTFDGIEGIKVTFKQVSEGVNDKDSDWAKGATPFVLTVEQDGDKTTEALDALVKSFNDAITKLNELCRQGSEEDGIESGPFSSDGLVRLLVRDLKASVTSIPLFDIDKKEGTIKFDKEKLDAKLKEDPDYISKIIGNKDGGWLGEISPKMTSWIKKDGLLDKMTQQAKDSADEAKEAAKSLQEAIERDIEINVAKFAKVQNAWMSMQISNSVLDGLFGNGSKK